MTVVLRVPCLAGLPAASDDQEKVCNYLYGPVATKLLRLRANDKNLEVFDVSGIGNCVVVGRWSFVWCCYVIPLCYTSSTISYLKYTFNLGTVLFRPLWTHQRSIEE